MNSHRILSFIFMTAAFAVAVTLSGEISPQLQFLVTVEGKSFYADYAEGRDWQAARAYCTSIGMKFASIKTAVQLEALANVSNQFERQGSYWVNARDAMALRQFSWDDTEEELAEDLNYSRSFSDHFLSCLQFLTAGPSSFLYSRACADTYGTLCEIYLPGY